MLPTINGKPLLDCSLEDIQSVLGNPDYRENEYLDYKGYFSILEHKNQERENAKAEFRSDVCAMANANGGYLIFGIQEDGKGTPSHLSGISIPDDNTDKFELNIKNWLQPIQPRLPNYSLSFVRTENGRYIVVMFIRHDFFAPYIHLVDEKDYRIYKRVGNSKSTLTYSELKTMFSQSFALDKELKRFREERIESYRMQLGSSYRMLLLQIVPDTFLDSNNNQPMFVLERKGTKFSNIFQSFDCSSNSFPMVEGLRYLSYNQHRECRLYNNGIAEIYDKLLDVVNTYPRNSNTEILDRAELWEEIEETVKRYIEIMKSVLNTSVIYVCISICGCEGIITSTIYNGDSLPAIDRGCLLTVPVVFENIGNEDLIGVDIKRLQLEYLLSLGIRSNSDVLNLTKELYGV